MLTEKPLEERSLTQLRALASAMGINIVFGDDKRKIIGAIGKKVNDSVPKPKEFTPLEPADPMNCGTSQKSILAVLDRLIKQGLIVSFPSSDQWHMQRDKKSDSGTMKMPLRSIVRCAENVCR